MEQVVWQTVRSPPSALASAGPWACAHGIQDVAPAGAEEPKLSVKAFCCIAAETPFS